MDDHSEFRGNFHFEDSHRGFFFTFSRLVFPDITDFEFLICYALQCRVFLGQVPINAETVQVGFSAKMSGLATYQEPASSLGTKYETLNLPRGDFLSLYTLSRCMDLSTSAKRGSSTAV